MGIQATLQPPVPPGISVPAAAYAAGRTMTIGLPVGENQLDGKHIRVRLSDGRWLTDAQTSVLAHWPDGDPKWVLASFPAPSPGSAPLTLTMERTDGPAHLGAAIASESDTEYTVRAGGLTFTIPKGVGYGLITQIQGPDGPLLQSSPDSAIDLVAVGDTGQVFRARRDQVWLSENGPYRAILEFMGRLATPGDGGRTVLCNYLVEAEFDANRPGPVLRVTVRNDDQTVRKNIRFQGLSIDGKFTVNGPSISVTTPTPDAPFSVTTTGETSAVQGLSSFPLQGATDYHFKGPDGLQPGYTITAPNTSKRYDQSHYPQTAYILASDDYHGEVFASIRHLPANWGSLAARPSGEIEVGLLSRDQGPHTMRLGTWETREAMILLGKRGTIDAQAEAIAFEYPRLVRLQNMAVWNKTNVWPFQLSTPENRMALLTEVHGNHRDLMHCPDSISRVRYHYSGMTGGPNQWDAGHDYWFAWASSGDPNAWLLAEAWADYRTDHAVPHAGTVGPVNPNEFHVTSGEEVFDNAHRHSRYLPLWFWQTGQARFDVAAHDEFSSLYGSDRYRDRYIESRITSRLIELGAIFAAFERDRGSADAGALYPKVRDYVGYMLSLRYNFDDPGGSRGWANDPGKRDRDPRTFWAAKNGKGDPHFDITFMVASLIPQALLTWVQYSPPDDPYVPVARQRLVDMADFDWEYLISKADVPKWRGTFFNFDCRRGVGPPPGYGDPGYNPNDPPDLYHPLYCAFVGAYMVTHDQKYLDHAAYWCAAQTFRNAPWVTFHRPDFQSFCACTLSH